MSFDAEKTLLLIIDVQNDFCPAYVSAKGGQFPNGALAVGDGCGVVEPLNFLAKEITARGGRAAATQDWHPLNHVSFASSHKAAADNAAPLWPDHCVQGTSGAALHEDLDTRYLSLIIRKGFRLNLDSYSAFYENDRVTPTGLDGWIKSLGLQTVILGGLATDYCVYYSAMDCKKLGFNTIVASDAVRAVGIPEGSAENAVKTMKDAGIDFFSVQELYQKIKKD